MVNKNRTWLEIFVRSWMYSTVTFLINFFNFFIYLRRELESILGFDPAILIRQTIIGTL